MREKDLADGEWQAVDLPHDYAIEGPFRLDLAGETRKLPYQGIGWYRKHFSYTKKGANVFTLTSMEPWLTRKCGSMVAM